MSLKESLKGIYCNENFCKFLIILDALLWGFSYLVIKDVVNKIEVGWMLAIRFLVGALIIYAFTYKKINSNFNKENIWFGVVLGLYGFGGYLTQNIGITFTTPGKNAFLTGTYSVMVPFVAYAMGLGKPERYNVVGAFVALIGLGFVALDNGFPLNIGDVLTLICALFYSLQIVTVFKQGTGMDVATTTFWEFVVMGVGSLVWAMVKETPPNFATFVTTDYLQLAYICLICSIFGIATSNHAFQYVDPTAGGLLASLESPFGVIFSVWLGYEVLTGRLLLGFALILVGVVFSEGGPAIIAWFNKKYKHVEEVEVEEVLTLSQETE